MSWNGLDDYNYYGDTRTQARGRSTWYDDLDHATMTATVSFTDYSSDEEEERVVSLPFRFEVCSLCNGKGTHTDPSIDCGGLTYEDFDEDPGFADDYMSGSYDVGCYQCGGKRVTAEVDRRRCNDDQLAVLAYLAEAAAEEAEYEAMCLAERRAGC